ncbi:transposase-like protein [Sphingomonas sp. UYAg733]
MGQVRHGSATTTHAVRAAIQRSQASLSALSRELGINPKTVAKWRKRATVEDLKTGLSGFPCVCGRLNITPPWP